MVVMIVTSDFSGDCDGDVGGGSSGGGSDRDSDPDDPAADVVAELMVIEVIWTEVIVMMEVDLMVQVILVVMDAGCDHGRGSFGGNGDITMMMILLVITVAVMKVMG